MKELLKRATLNQASCHPLEEEMFGEHPSLIIRMVYNHFELVGFAGDASLKFFNSIFPLMQ